MGWIEKGIFALATTIILALFTIYVFFGQDCNREKLVNAYIGMNVMWFVTMIIAAVYYTTKIFDDGAAILCFTVMMILHIIGTVYSYPIGPGNCDHVFYYTAFVEFNIIPYTIVLCCVFLAIFMACGYAIFERDNKIGPLRRVVHVENIDPPNMVVINVTTEEFG